MTVARTIPEYRTSAADHPDLATRHHHRASKLFDKDHAYAARLVQIATAIRDVVRSTTTMKLPDRVPSSLKGTTGARQTSSADRGRAGAAHRQA